MSGAGGGFAGMNNGSYFRAPGWVDLSKRPGESRQVPPEWGAWATAVLKCGHVLYSPNTVWLSFALLDWFVFPWDLEAAKTWSAGWVLWRLAVNMLLTTVYTGFWHVALYVLHWSQRKFSPGTLPAPGRVAHNCWYTTLGVVQWTAWEAIFMHIYATDRLPHIKDAEAFATPGNIARMVFWTAAIPIFRGCHFYFAHRLIHLKVIYKFVHSLHHRNIDIEPFAGLCMHPIEHLYYFSCIAPSLWFYMHPFHLVWNGMHLLLSPAASHSGWEDHMQSDQFHYLHHKKFECNYGSASFPLDNLFGTFRETLYGQSVRNDRLLSLRFLVKKGSFAKTGSEQTQGKLSKWCFTQSTYSGAGAAAGGDNDTQLKSSAAKLLALEKKEADKKTTAPIKSSTDDTKDKPGPSKGQGKGKGKGKGEAATVAAEAATATATATAAVAVAVKYPPMGRSPKGFHVYMVFTFALFLLAFCAIFPGSIRDKLLPELGLGLMVREPRLLAGTVAFGPVIFAALLMRLVGDRSDMSWPFHKDGLPKLSLHVVLGFILAVLPVYQTLMTLLAPPEQRVYCQLWGCPDLLSPGEGGVGASALPQDDVSAAAADMRTAR